MGSSALLGQPPANAQDAAIQKAIHALKGSEFFPDPSLPYGIPMPYPGAPDPRKNNSLAAFGSLLAIGVLVTAGRIYYRLSQRVRLGVDDALAILAAAALVAYAQLLMVEAIQGCYAHHIYWCTYSDFNHFFQKLSVGQPIFYLIVYSSKTSLLFLNRRITGFTQGWWTKYHHVLLVILIGAFIFSVCGTIFTCNPIPPHFSLAILGETNPAELHCATQTVQNNIQEASRGLHIATDLLLLALPILVISRLQMPVRKKLALLLLFCFGIVCTIASIMRIEIYKIPTSDATWDLDSLVIWDLIDAAFAVIVASMPLCYVPFDRLWGRVHQTASRTFYGSSSHHGDSQGGKTSNTSTHIKGTFVSSLSEPLEIRYGTSVSVESDVERGRTSDGEHSDGIELITKT